MSTTRPKPASTALAVFGSGAAVFVWLMVLNGGVPRWLAWMYVGLNAFVFTIKSIEFAVFLWTEAD